MLTKLWPYIMNQNGKWSLYSLFFLISCAPTSSSINNQKPLERFMLDTSKKTIRTYCTEDDQRNKKISIFQFGDIICPHYILNYSSKIQLKIKYHVLNSKSDDPYKRGFHELQLFYQDKLIQSLSLRNKDDAAWTDTPFVRIREKKYFSDLNGDDNEEFAIFPFSPGSAMFGTVRIYSLFKNKVKFLKNAKYHIEGDGHALLNCPDCSKLNFSECQKCN